jgi:ribosome-associated protein
MTKTAEEVLELVVKAADDKRAVDILALDMKGISLLSDYNVVMHGNSDRQIGAIAQGIIGTAQEAGVEVRRIEGKDSAKWILIDLGDVIAHVFNEEERDFFKLESLWTEAADVDITKWIEL